MRKLTTGFIVGTTLAMGAAGTVAVLGSSPTEAAPSPTPKFCGQFAGTGPAPGCSYVARSNNVVISLRNNGIRPAPVKCDLTPSGRDRPVDSTTLGPGGSGTVSASIVPGSPRAFLLACRSVTDGAPEVARQLTLTVSAPRATTTPRATPRTTTTRTRPAPTVTTTSPNASPNATAPRSRPPSSTRPLTTTTTTTTTAAA